MQLKVAMSLRKFRIYIALFLNHRTIVIDLSYTIRKKNEEKIASQLPYFLYLSHLS